MPQHQLSIAATLQYLADESAPYERLRVPAHTIRVGMGGVRTRH